jgi:hypothetical protein
MRSHSCDTITHNPLTNPRIGNILFYLKFKLIFTSVVTLSSYSLMIRKLTLNIPVAKYKHVSCVKYIRTAAAFHFLCTFVYVSRARTRKLRKRSISSPRRFIHMQILLGFVNQMILQGLRTSSIAQGNQISIWFCRMFDWSRIG